MRAEGGTGRIATRAQAVEGFACASATTDSTAQAVTSALQARSQGPASALRTLLQTTVRPPSGAGLPQAKLKRGYLVSLPTCTSHLQPPEWPRNTKQRAICYREEIVSLSDDSQLWPLHAIPQSPARSTRTHSFIQTFISRLPSLRRSFLVTESDPPFQLACIHFKWKCLSSKKESAIRKLAAPFLWHRGFFWLATFQNFANSRRSATFSNFEACCQISGLSPFKGHKPPFCGHLSLPRLREHPSTYST